MQEKNKIGTLPLIWRFVKGSKHFFVLSMLMAALTAFPT